MTEFDLLVGFGPTVEDVAKCLAKIVGHDLVKDQTVDWDRYTTNAMCVQLNLFYPHGFDNDQGIEFDKYQCAISVIALNITLNNPSDEEWRRFFTLFLGNMISQELEVRCIALENLVRVIEMFPLIG